MTGGELSQLALGRSIAETRRRRGWTQPELAAMLGRPVAWLSRLERGLVPAGPDPVPGAAASAPLPAQPGGGPDADPGRPEAARALRLVLAAAGPAPGTGSWLGTRGRRWTRRPPGCGR